MLDRGARRPVSGPVEQRRDGLAVNVMPGVRAEHDRELERRQAARVVDPVEQHGERIVWDRGEAALGVPPTWATSAREIATVKDALKEK